MLLLINHDHEYYLPLMQRLVLRGFADALNIVCENAKNSHQTRFTGIHDPPAPNC